MRVCQSSPYSPFDSRALDYFGKAKAVVTTHTHTIRSGLGLWPHTKACQNETDPDPEIERASKRRKGVAGTIISTALDAAFDAAIFTSAVGYAAFQIWRGKPLDEPSHTRLPAPVPRSPPPPYEQCSTPLPPPLPRSRPTPVKRASFAPRKVTHIHVPRSRPAKPYLSSTSSTLIPNFTLESLNINSPTSTPGSEPAPEEQEEDLMADFVPSFSHYVPPPPVPDEPVDTELETDEELVAWKNQIQGLIRSGEAALAAMPELPIAPEIEPELQQMVVKEERVKRSEEVQILERALDQTARGTGRNWWETA
ncbi:hypothetical protein CROQUDRAFT_339091 [Cronartium quercuum f. sp. fusiforme G11]|uniref:Uncharacterized protein n=1 Tax=Cronartium quercuum f. sp. fusiforme G11 TaxID=708437 RepID=A0A9P6NPD6_9BASI|nr:hypothetical protein CROQUDRAFT_339091 [Cronartium quercuum f. sp. fusiforme G11]